MKDSYSIRVDRDTHDTVSRIFNQVGLTFSSGISLMLSIIAYEEKLPFTLSPMSVNQEKEDGE